MQIMIVPEPVLIHQLEHVLVLTVHSRLCPICVQQRQLLPQQHLLQLLPQLQFLFPLLPQVFYFWYVVALQLLFS